LAGSKDKTKYDLLDINKPETLLIRGKLIFKDIIIVLFVCFLISNILKL